VSPAFSNFSKQPGGDAGLDAFPTTTIVVGDELGLVREGLVKICNDLRQCRVVAQCPDGASALKAIEHLQPDLALLDLHLGETFSLEVVRRLRDANSPTRVVILSTRRDRKTALECIRAGAAGFVLKSGPLEHLAEAVYQIRSGAVYVTPLVDINRPADAADLRDPLETLSAREYQVFSLMIDGVRAKEIAARLDLSPKTVDTYRSSLMRKLDIHDVAGLVKFAIQRELTTTRQ
jgi:DNA-binding NarL/FixJ family response regulator